MKASYSRTDGTSRKQGPMFTVALIGPDGAGKTTIARQLEHKLPVPVKYLYMGVSPDSSNVMLPTTRLMRAVKRRLGAKPDVGGPPDPNRIHRPRSQGVIKQAIAGVRSSLRLVNRLSEEWFRQGLVWYYQWRGHIVLFDRHFFSDYYAYDIANSAVGQSLSRRIHGFMLARLYPKPDLVIYLDAPGEVLYARKGEGTVEALERRRQDYLQLAKLIKHFIIVDATQPRDKVAHDVAKSIWGFYEAQNGRRQKVQHVEEQTG